MSVITNEEKYVFLNSGSCSSILFVIFFVLGVLGLVEVLCLFCCLVFLFDMFYQQQFSLHSIPPFTLVPHIHGYPVLRLKTKQQQKKLLNELI